VFDFNLIGWITHGCVYFDPIIEQPLHNPARKVARGACNHYRFGFVDGHHLHAPLFVGWNGYLK
jgi:hypothetical protein